MTLDKATIEDIILYLMHLEGYYERQKNEYEQHADNVIDDEELLQNWKDAIKEKQTEIDRVRTIYNQLNRLIYSQPRHLKNTT